MGGVGASGVVRSGGDFGDNHTAEYDFVVVGSGPGGSMAAAVLAGRGARVALVEEGSRYSRRDFNMEESWAYPHLYQEHGNRATDDLSIIILQGRTVGGGTTVNWTSSYRTPDRTLALWASRHGVAGLDSGALAPHFAAVEQRLSIGPGNEDDVNRNNRKLWDGASKLGWKPELIRRNVKGCARLGYCGMGCPLDAKQSALITYVPDALAAGADLYTDCRAKLIETDRRSARAVVAEALDRETDRPTGRRVVLHARRGVVLAAGAINSPALLLRSRIADSSGMTGRRTFLHPTVPLVAYYSEPIEAFYGPPQSVACHHFAERGDRLGYFLETAPIHPMLAALAFPGFGAEHRRAAERLAQAQATIALLIDGHHDDPGGRVTVDRDGRVRLSYPLRDAHVEAARDALANMARLQLAAGAEFIATLHDPPLLIRSESDIAQIARADFGANRHTLFSAHQMGGCAMGGDPRTSVVDPHGRHHDLDNLWITDGSIFPTSLGVNPQLSIYAIAKLLAEQIPTA